MSNLETAPQARVCGGREEVAAAPVRELLTGKQVPLGESTVVRRLLPSLGRRMVGAWCFVDHYGPDDIVDQPGMRVAPHPHIGLQTVSWLHAGEVTHRDSLGSLATVRPRELGLMTAGQAISHSEESPRGHGPLLHGAQLWVALPDAHRHTDPHFEHHPVLPEVTAPGLHATVILGDWDGSRSPGATYSPLLGADLTLAEGTVAGPPLDPDFEYAVLAMSGRCGRGPGRARLDALPRLRPPRPAAARRHRRHPAAARRRALRRAAGDVVELRRPLRRRRRPGPGGLDDRHPLRRGARLRRRAAARPGAPAGPAQAARTRPLKAWRWPGLDDEALAEAMRLLGTKTKKDTVNTALRDVVAGLRALEAFDRLAERGARGEFDQAADAHAAAKRARNEAWAQ